MSIRERPKDPTRVYEHRFHAGNAGDVWKHVALLALLDRCGGVPLYLETHAGAGRYALAPTGEWREGIGRLLSAPREATPACVRRYLEAVAAPASVERGFTYPGSPALAAGTSGVGRLVLYDLHEAPRARLAAELGADPRVRVVAGDGMAALANGLAADLDPSQAAVVLVDPPFHEKREWTDLPVAVAAAVRAQVRATVMVWYPIKSHTRPNAMLARLRAEGVAGVSCELVTAPLAARTNRLAGSGVVLVRPPPGLLAELATAAVFLGPRLAIVPDVWHGYTSSWSAAPASPDTPAS